MSGKNTEKAPEQIVVAQSQNDLFLRQLMDESKSEPTEWYAGMVEVDERHRSMFILPEELRDGHPRQHSESKSKAYCWVEVSDQRIANMYRQMKWIPVNRTNHGFLPDHLFDVLGAIKRTGHTVHVLFFQPRDFNDRIKEAQGKKHEDRKKDAETRLDHLSGPVRVEYSENISTEGGYGVTPNDNPIQMDFDGKELKDADAFEYVE